MVSATDFKNVMNITTSPTDLVALLTGLEYVIDLAIDSLNIFGASLSNMSGTAGTKTVDLTSKQRGGVLVVAREIYQKFYIRAGTATASGAFTVTVGDLLNDNEFANLCEKIAGKLASTSEGVAFVVAEDTSGIE